MSPATIGACGMRLPGRELTFSDDRAALGGFIRVARVARGGYAFGIHLMRMRARA